MREIVSLASLMYVSVLCVFYGVSVAGRPGTVSMQAAVSGALFDNIYEENVCPCTATQKLRGKVCALYQCVSLGQTSEVQLFWRGKPSDY